jgi:hypothetical protein
MKFNTRKIIALILTFFLGPGTGHLLYRQWRKAILLILGTLFLGISFFARALQPLANQKNITPEVITEQLKIFIFHNQGSFTFYYIVLAAIWAYALTEIFLMDK